MKIRHPPNNMPKLPFRGTFIMSKRMKNINSDMIVIDMNTGSSLPMRAAPNE